MPARAAAKVAKPLQSLCVSVFYGDEESSKQLEESITGIVNYISTTSTRKLTRDIEQLHEKREELKTKHEELRHALLNAMGDDRFIASAFHRHTGRGPFSESEFGVLGRFLPHILQAIRFQLQLRDLQRENQDLRGALEGLVVGEFNAEIDGHACYRLLKFGGQRFDSATFH